MIDPKFLRAEEAARIAELEAVLKKREEGRMAPVTVEANECQFILSSPSIQTRTSASPNQLSEEISSPRDVWKNSLIANGPRLSTSCSGPLNFITSEQCDTALSSLQAFQMPPHSESMFDADASGPMDGSAMGWVSREEVELGRFRKLQAYREKRRKECVTKLNAVFGVRRFSIIAGALGVVKKAAIRMVGG